MTDSKKTYRQIKIYGDQVTHASTFSLLCIQNSALFLTDNALIVRLQDGSDFLHQHIAVVHVNAGQLRFPLFLKAGHASRHCGDLLEEIGQDAVLVAVDEDIDCVSDADYHLL